MKLITQENWDKTPSDYKGVWTTERTDWPEWERVKDSFMGKKTLLTASPKGTALMVEGIHFQIVANK